MVEQILLVAVIQGLTEFLPVSSSGHTNLLHGLTRLPDHGLAVDVAVHMGTLVAVVVYNRRDLAAMALSLLTLGRSERAWFGVTVSAIVATVPVTAAGYWLNSQDALLAAFRSVEVVAWATLVFGILLGVADRSNGRRRLMTLNIGDGFAIGLAQVLALVPGTSRAGIAMTAARTMGLGRRAAMRISMILSVPVILGSGVVKGAEMVAADAAAWFDITLAAAVAMIVALPAIHVMMAVVQRVGFMPFVVYRILLGAALLWVVYS